MYLTLLWAMWSPRNVAGQASFSEALVHFDELLFGEDQIDDWQFLCSELNAGS